MRLPVDLPEHMSCPWCGGTGLEDPWAADWIGEWAFECEWCGGTGLIPRQDPNGVVDEWADRMRARRWAREEDL